MPVFGAAVLGAAVRKRIWDLGRCYLESNNRNWVEMTLLTAPKQHLGLAKLQSCALRMQSNLGWVKLKGVRERIVHTYSQLYVRT